MKNVFFRLFEIMLQSLLIIRRVLVFFFFSSFLLFLPLFFHSFLLLLRFFFSKRCCHKDSSVTTCLFQRYLVNLYRFGGSKLPEMVVSNGRAKTSVLTAETAAQSTARSDQLRFFDRKTPWACRISTINDVRRKRASGRRLTVNILLTGDNVLQIGH